MKIYVSASQQPFNVYYDGLFNEQEVMQSIAQKVGTKLRYLGFDVKVSPLQTLRDNIREANEWGADAYVSLHSNAYNGEARGPVGFYASDQGKQLAQLVYNEVNAIAPVEGEGIRKNPLAELLQTNMPSTLIEVSYHDNPDDMKWILLHQDEIAQAITNGILQYAQLNGYV